MRSSCFVVLMLVLITVVAARSSYSVNVHDIKVLKRSVDGETQNVIFLMLKIPSTPSGYVNLSVPLSSGSGICLKSSSGRGIGTPLINVCNGDEEIYGALCYPKCLDSYESVGCCLCRHEGCPPEFTDDGVATCIKPQSYGRGAGYPWEFGDELDRNNMFKRCEADHGAGLCEESGSVVYPKCRSGFHAVGCCVCSPSCPDGMNDIGISCGKKSYARGVGVSRLTCPDNKEEDALLCYNKCPSGWYGLGSVCWQNCPSHTPFDCGVMCTVDESACFNQTSVIVKSAIEVGGNIFTGIATNDIVKIIQAALKAARTVANVMSNEYC